MILDSVSKEGIRLTTMELTYPRFIHSEFMTHRVFSRNASSSRAIPVHKMIDMIRETPAEPIHWGKNQSGMQAENAVDPDTEHRAQLVWKHAAIDACKHAEEMVKLGIHKQVANRITEPFAHIKVLVTATEWENFFSLRCHPDAQPEIQELAVQMKRCMSESTPTELSYYQWHLPFVTAEEKDHHDLSDLLKASTARCARVSYMNHDGSKPDMNKDAVLYDQLITSRPIHASPTEHQAAPSKRGDDYSGCLLYTSPSPRDLSTSRMPSSA